MAESSGNGPQRPGSSRLAAGANTPMAKTIALVVLAVIVGIVMINIVDDGGTSGQTASSTTTVGTSATTAPTNTTVGTSGGNGSTTTTAKASNAVIPPGSLQMIVVNSGAPTGSGGNVSDALKGKGYTKQSPTTKVSWTEKGLIVRCQPNLERERTALVQALAGIPNYTAKAASWKVQPGISAAQQCYVAIGAAT